MTQQHPSTQTERTNLNNLWGELIVEELLRNGVDYFCIAPGSRSTPLTVAVARNPKARHVICYDERGAAYHAVGYARATQQPAAVITSSGTATANLYPAVVEAALDHLPLILLTADRPPELHQTQANQTIDQLKLFGDYPRWHVSLPTPTEEIRPEAVLTTVDNMVYHSLRNPAGPVHLNCMFREPLEPTAYQPQPTYTHHIEAWQQGSHPFTTYQKPLLTSEMVGPMAQLINRAEKGLLAVGKLKSDEERAAVLQLIRTLNWPTYVDVNSGLRLTDVGTHVIRHFDQSVLSPAFLERATPDTVLQVGGRITSKRYPQFLDDVRPSTYIVVKDNPSRYDPLHGVTHHIEADVACFCRQLTPELHPREVDDYSRFFQTKAAQTQQIIERRLTEFADISDAYVARSISRHIPDGSSLFLSNSMPVRDMDLYGVEHRAKVYVATNRGTSGIDGVTATAAGFAVGKQTRCTLLIGDLAFMHDLSSLSFIDSLPVPLVIVIINNQGGGIFHFLPIVKNQDVFETYFATPHPFSFSGVSQTFDLEYHFVDTKAAFDTTYKAALTKNISTIIEVKTNRDDNLALRRAIKFEIVAMLEQ